MPIEEDTLGFSNRWYPCPPYTTCGPGDAMAFNAVIEAGDLSCELVL